MDVRGSVASEDDTTYRNLEAANLSRQYRFLTDVIEATSTLGLTGISPSLVKAFNTHAIAGLHEDAGEYRQQDVVVGPYQPPPHLQVEALMDRFLLHVNGNWPRTEPIELAAYALWQINAIHPFINGNGRTARAIGYFILCVKVGGALPGEDIVPALLSDPTHYPRYLDTLQRADQGNLEPLEELLAELVDAQLRHVAA
jgi:Fic family protein